MKTVLGMALGAAAGFFFCMSTVSPPNPICTSASKFAGEGYGPIALAALGAVIGGVVADTL